MYEQLVDKENSVFPVICRMWEDISYAFSNSPENKLFFDM